jgi:hypothetical protein
VFADLTRKALFGSVCRLVQARGRPTEIGACSSIARRSFTPTEGSDVLAPFAAIAGDLTGGSRFADTWNGSVLRAVRSTISTADEWAQCTNCWYREGTYEQQRRAFDRDQPRADLTRRGRFTSAAWDFESYRQ